jgi:hypothetical protein
VNKAWQSNMASRKELKPLIKPIDWKKVCSDWFDCVKLHKLVVKYGPQILFEYDEEGFYPIHWAILAGTFYQFHL